MVMSIFGRNIRLAALLLTILLGVGAAHAAGEWEWTSGQGWVQGAGVSRPTPKEQLHYAYELEKRGEFMDSARQYFLLVQNFPASQEAGVGLQRLARCLFEMENYWTSYKAIEQVIETYPNTGRMSDLVEIELRIAKKLMVSQTPDILSGDEAKSRDFNIRRALQIVDSVIEHDPYGPVAAEAYLVKGEGHLFLNEVKAARAAFETIRDEFSRSDYIERARLGIIVCDQLVGEAKPQEVEAQMEIVRETERERTRNRRDEMDGLDNVEDSFRQLNEVEAAKMMEQAEQYRRMGTKKSVESSQFLYKEITRRYPGTPQADEAMERLGHLRIPKEPGKLGKTLKGINLNPFTINKEPQAAFIVPQLAPGDMVMVDKGLGPIIGVPESGSGGLPQTDNSAAVRPFALPEEDLAHSPDGSYSPADIGRGQAPEFIDATDAQNTYGSAAPYSPVPAPETFRSDFAADRRLEPRNPFTSIQDSDLVMPAGPAGGYADAGQYRGYQAPSPYEQPAAPAYTQPSGPPSLGSPMYHTPYSDLVGPPPKVAAQPPLPDYDGITSYEPRYDSRPEPEPTYRSQEYYYPDSYPPPAPPRTMAEQYGSNGNWTLGEDFR